MATHPTPLVEELVVIAPGLLGVVPFAPPPDVVLIVAVAYEATITAFPRSVVMAL
jgi:hypothetical protein